MTKLNFTVRFAIDKKSVRSFDADGRLHVELTPISKSNVCPYMGKEIPDAEELGLEPDKIYQLLRDPEELAKAAPTFNGIQLLRQHIPVSADDHQPYDVVGSTGTDAEFKEPYLYNSLAIWVKDDIADVESKKKMELSSAYRYKADMTPGTYKGVRYDGIMRDICGNHVAIVHEGRAGKDVMVADSKHGMDSTRGAHDMGKKVILTRKGAVVLGGLVGFLKPRLAADAQLDWGKIVGPITHKNFSGKKGAIIAGLKEQLKGKLAKDASIDGLVELLDSLDNAEPPEDGSKDALETGVNSGLPFNGEKHTDLEDQSMDADEEDSPESRLKKYLQDKGMSEDDIAGACDALGTEEAAAEGEDEEPGEGGEKDAAKMAKEKEAAKDKKAKDEPPPFKGKPEVTKDEVNRAIKKVTDDAKLATDKAIAAARQEAKDTREAERFVRPWVGDLAMAHDSATEVYRTALTALGVDTVKESIHPSAFKTLLERLPKPSEQKSHQAQDSAMDSASTDDFNKRFPMTTRIGVA